MKVAQLNYSDSRGGAARAAYRIHKAVLKAGIESTLYVVEKNTDDWTVEGPKNIYRSYLAKARNPVGRVVSKLLRTNNKVIHTPAFLPSSWPEILNKSTFDIVHLHWIAGEMLSVREIGRFKKPLVWTLHDMWAFCGAEHYAEDNRYVEGYFHTNRPNQESGVDLNRWVWKRKQKYWKNEINIVAPSKWLAECAKNSYLMRDYNIQVIPNAIDTKYWRPIEQETARDLLGLPKDKLLLLFAADGGINDPRKGFDLLRTALKYLKDTALGMSNRIELVIFGQSRPKIQDDYGFNVNYLGRLTDDLTMMLAYSSVDLMAIPSRMDNLPNTGLESLACGTPVIAFEIGGMVDIIKHGKTGFLATPFNTEMFAEGIEWILGDERRRSAMKTNARDYAQENYSYELVGNKYMELYHEIINK